MATDISADILMDVMVKYRLSIGKVSVKYRCTDNYSGRHVCTDVSTDMSVDIAFLVNGVSIETSTDTRSRID